MTFYLFFLANPVIVVLPVVDDAVDDDGGDGLVSMGIRSSCFSSLFLAVSELKPSQMTDKMSAAFS